MSNCFFGGYGVPRTIGWDGSLLGAEIEVEEVVVVYSIVSIKCRDVNAEVDADMNSDGDG